MASALLDRAHSPDTAAAILRERVKQRPLLLRPTSPDRHANARAQRQHARLQNARAVRRPPHRPAPLSAQQKRALGVHDIPPSQRKYAIYAPLHRMWCGYIREILGLTDGKRTCVDANGAGPMLVAADYHGALVEVVRSRCPGRVGLRGVVVKDTKFTYEVVTVRDEIKTVPKEHTVFRFEVPLEAVAEGADNSSKPLVFEIHGSQFENRAPDRANKKFRQHFDPDL